MSHPWPRLLWGVAAYIGENRHAVLGDAWDPATPSPLTGRPSRALLFTSRAAAREWCRIARAKHNDCYRFTPVRVRETVERA